MPSPGRFSCESLLFISLSVGSRFREFKQGRGRGDVHGEGKKRAGTEFYKSVVRVPIHCLLK